MNVVEKKFVILPQLFYILDRLEGYRRSFICDVTILCSKLKTLCLFNQHISAIEDIPLLIGVLIDILNFSAVNPFIRGGIIEQALPSLLKLLELIVDRKIKSRQYYIFISHRLLQIFTTLIRFSSTGLDAQQTSINKVFLDLFINEKIKIIPWLKRYAYLILLNSRVRLELSGLFVNQDQCN